MTAQVIYNQIMRHPKKKRGEIIWRDARTEKSNENFARQILRDGLVAQAMVNVTKDSRRVGIVNLSEFSTRIRHAVP